MKNLTFHPHHIPYVYQSLIKSILRFLLFSSFASNAERNIVLISIPEYVFAHLATSQKRSDPIPNPHRIIQNYAPSG